MSDQKIKVPDTIVHAVPGIGVDFAGKDAALPYRFYVRHNELKELDLLSE